VFPPAFFLDADLFQQCQLTIARDCPSIPSYLQEFVGDLDSIRNAAAKYFDEIHSWMPIVAKKRLFRHLLSPLSRLRADIALLIVAMRIITLFPMDSATDPKSPMYVAAKRYFAEAEMAGFLTLPCLQAAVLMSIYEYGHAVYPAAFFTVASCARYAAILGVDKEDSVCKDSSLSWVEVEERRRVWWAILIMDRYVLCNMLRHFQHQQIIRSPFRLSIIDTNLGLC
jgi:Fungal specific transcription factor domain